MHTSPRLLHFSRMITLWVREFIASEELHTVISVSVNTTIEIYILSGFHMTLSTLSWKMTCVRQAHWENFYLAAKLDTLRTKTNRFSHNIFFIILTLNNAFLMNKLHFLPFSIFARSGFPISFSSIFTEKTNSSPTTVNLLMRTYPYIYAFRERITRATIFSILKVFFMVLKLKPFYKSSIFQLKKYVF